MSTKDKTFILGLGAQKAATSWLYHYANSDAAAEFGGLKEYRVWDALEHPQMGHFDVRPHKRVNRTIIRMTSMLKRRGPNGWRLRGHLQQNLEHYFDYFEEQLDAPNINITGDITPSYAGLSVATLERIQTEFKRREIEVKTFFIMRDPIARAISAARMNRTKHDWREEVPQLMSFDKAILHYVKSQTYDLLANYTRTVENTRAVFGSDGTYFGFYETMFEPHNLKDLSDYLGVTYRPEKVKTKFYRTKSDMGISPETKSEMRKILAPVYDFCAKEFPETVDLWAH